MTLAFKRHSLCNQPNPICLKIFQLHLHDHTFALSVKYPTKKLLFLFLSRLDGRRNRTWRRRRRSRTVRVAEWLSISSRSNDKQNKDEKTEKEILNRSWGCALVELSTQVQQKVRHKEESQKSKSGSILLDMSRRTKITPFLSSQQRVDITLRLSLGIHLFN